MTILEFVTMAIKAAKEKARISGKDYKGLHTVYSGLNDEIRAMFGEDTWDKETRKAFPIIEVKKLVEQGHIESHFAHGGAMIYLKGEMPNIKAKITKDSVMKKYGLLPPPVIAPVEAKRPRKPKPAPIDQPEAA